MAGNISDMKLLEIACDQGLITSTQLELIRREHMEAVQSGRRKSPTRIAIERGILSDEDTQDLETEAWIRSLPSDLDGYHLTRLVGRGGMAVVFEAQDVSLGKVVAIKVLRQEFSSSESYLARFHREARIAAKLTHPNAVQVFRAGESDDINYLVMEFVKGETLSSILRRRGRIPEREALDIILQVTGALEEAAGMGIVHRDIKPGNIMISKWNVPKLADFGIAKEFGDIRDPRIQRSLTMGVVGTPAYMSPEQARGMRHLDSRSDIYSLGTTLYHMVVGDLPFHADTPQETMALVLSEAPRPPRAAYPSLSEATAAVICKMMAKEPENRYADFDTLRTDLAAARDGKEVSMGYRDAVRLLRPSPTEPAKRSEEGSPLRAVAVAAGVVLVGLLLLFILRSCSGMCGELRNAGKHIGLGHSPFEHLIHLSRFA